MGARNFFMLGTHFDFSGKGGLKELVYGGTFWVLISKFMFYLVGSLIRSIFRVHAVKDFESDQSKTSLAVSEQENPNGPSGYAGSNPNRFCITETDFHCLNSNHGDETNGEDEVSSVVMKTGLVPTNSRYESLSDKVIVSCFMEEPKAVSFVVQEHYLCSDNAEIASEQTLEKSEGSVESVQSSILEKKLEKEVDRVDSHMNEDMIEFEVVSCNDATEESVNCVAVDCENREKVCSIHMIDVSDDDFIEITVQNQSLGVVESENLTITGSREEEEEDDDDDDELGHNEVQHNNLGVLEPENLTMERSREEDVGFDDEDDESGHDEVQNETLGVLASENPTFEGSRQDDDDGPDDCSDDDGELEHDEVIERLRMELKTARTGGLPTILEESVLPELLEELKPMKIDAKIELKDRLFEIQKVYKNYSDKMRKLDVLNSQTSHSIGLLRLKESSQSNSRDKSANRMRKTLTGQNLWRFKQKRVEGDPIEKSIRDLHRDFETVYVGQLCLSWEILNWQYTKTLELKQHDVQRVFQYNLVADEFQLFQVLLQRFLENEPFQRCPRIENYVKNRAGFHNFLQVPLVKDDRSRGTKCMSERDFAITAEALGEMVCETMRVFCEFLRSDEYGFNPVSKALHQTRVAPQEPLDLDLLTDIITDLQKKEKRLKDMLRSGTCIVKKFRKSGSDKLIKDELFVARVELWLVSRVTNMARLTTDQLLWCREKLNKINFSSRKIRLDPTFSFFPC